MDRRGGRNLGEACHIYDLFLYLTGVEAVDYISACSILPLRNNGDNDNFLQLSSSAMVQFALIYTALGSKPTLKNE